MTSGRAAGYAVVVDNVTGDGSVFSFAPSPAGPQDVLVNGVTRAAGQLGTFWRTDARLFNPSSQDATVSVSWLPSGNSNASPTKASVAVQAGRIVDLPDVLSVVFGLPSGSSGALRFQTDQSVAVLCRTSNLDPTGVRPGTFGAQQASVPVLSFLTSADAGALVTAVRQGGAFRTNVGFAAGPDGATWQLTLKDASGATIGSGSGSLGPFGWTQPGVSGLFPNVTISDGSQIAVRVTAGSLDVYDSSIDNGSGDPVVTSAAPMPADIPSTATIGPEGGSVRSDDGRLTLKVPAGARRRADVVPDRDDLRLGTEPREPRLLDHAGRRRPRPARPRRLRLRPRRRIRERSAVPPPRDPRGGPLVQRPDLGRRHGAPDGHGAPRVARVRSRRFERRRRRAQGRRTP